MPRVTRSQAAALQNADGREPFEEVTNNIKLAEPTRRTTRARSKAGTRKENYDAEEQPVPAVDGAETSSHRAGTSVSNKSVRVTRSQTTKAPEVIVLDEVETIEVTTTKRTRSTRRTRHTAAGADTERQPEEVVALAPPAPTTRGRRAERDSLGGGSSKLSPSKIPSPIRPPAPSQGSHRKLDETPSKSAAAGSLAKGPSPVPISRSITRSAKKVTGEDLLVGKPAVKPFAARIAAVEQPKATPLADCRAPDTNPPAFGLPTPVVGLFGHGSELPPPLAASTPKSRFAPTTPATTKVKKVVALGSPFTSSPTRKVITRVPSTAAPLGSFASPTKAQLARRSTIFPSKSSSSQEGSSNNTSMIVNISEARPEKEQQPVSTNGNVNQGVVNPKPAPSVLSRKTPVIATTKAAMLRTQKATGKPAEPTIRTVTQRPDDIKVPAVQRPKDTVQHPGPSMPVVSTQPKAVIQKTDQLKPTVSAQTRPAAVAANRSAPIKPVVKVQAKTTIETVVKAVTRPLPRVATTISSQPKQESTKDVKPQQPATPGTSAATPRAQVPSLLRKPSIPTMSNVQSPSLSRKLSVPTMSNVQSPNLLRKPSVPTLPKATTVIGKKPSISELLKVAPTLSRKPSIPTLPKVQAPTLSKKPSIPALPTTTTLSKRPSIPTLPKTTVALSKKPSISTLPKTTTTLSKKPSIPTLPNATATLSKKPSSQTLPNAPSNLAKKPSISTLPNVAAAPLQNAPAPASFENPNIGEVNSTEEEPAKTTKLVAQKKPFQPVKSTKPLTVPIPFQYDPGNRAARPIGQSKAPLPQATLPKSSTATGVKDRMKKFETPKPKPVVLKDARTMLREMRKEARLGTLPQLTGEVVYAELPQIDDVAVTTPILPQEPSTKASALGPVVGPAHVAPTAAVIAPPASPTKTALPQPVSPTKPSTHDVIVVTGRASVSPQRTVPYEDFEKLKLAKDRAEAYARGTMAVVNWAAQEMTKYNAEVARRR
ncbi:hypothetical protein TWF281_003982 [Arthrobotrys megalospora]